MKEEQHIQDIFNTIRELPPEVELAGIEQFVLAQPITAFQPPAGGDGGTSGLLTIKNTIVMISSISIIGSVALFIGGGSDKPTAATASVTDTPTQQTLVLDSAPVLVDNAVPLAASAQDDVVSAPRPVSTYPLTPNWDTAYPTYETRYGVGIRIQNPEAPKAPVVAVVTKKDPSECDDEHHTVSTFAKELYGDGLIDPKDFSFSFNVHGLLVNGRRQPEAFFAKYRDLFERQTGAKLGRGCHLEASVNKGNCSASLSFDDQDNSKTVNLGATDCESCSHTRDLPAFSHVDLTSNGNLRIVAGATYSIEIMTDDEKEVEQLKTEVKDGVLIIRKEGKGKNCASLILTMPEDKLRRVSMSGVGNIDVCSEFKGVELLDVSGSGRIEVQKHLSTDQLHTTVTGSGNLTVSDVIAKKTFVSVPGSGSVEISGLSDDVTVSINGSGNAELGELHSQVAVCDIDGSGSIIITADREIKVSISGSGVVTYSGSPTVIQNITGSGIVEKRK